MAQKIMTISVDEEFIKLINELSEYTGLKKSTIVVKAVKEFNKKIKREV